MKRVKQGQNSGVVHSTIKSSIVARLSSVIALAAGVLLAPQAWASLVAQWNGDFTTTQNSWSVTVGDSNTSADGAITLGDGNAITVSGGTALANPTVVVGIQLDSSDKEGCLLELVDSSNYRLTTYLNDTTLNVTWRSSTGNYSSTTYISGTKDFGTTTNYLAYSYYKNSSNGSAIFVNGTQVGSDATGLKFTSNSISSFAIGANNNSGSLVGAKVTYIAIYDTALSSSTYPTVAGVSTPREAGTYAFGYTNYTNTQGIVTWNGSTTTFHSGTNMASTVHADDFASTDSSVAWQVFCNGQSAWSTPGSVLRFVDGFTTGNIDAQFSPLSIAGLIVESGATNYVMYGSNANKRHTQIGNRTSGEEGYIDVQEDFSINRTGNTTLYGSLNVHVASGKTFDLNSSQSSYTLAFESTPTPSLHMSGDGTMSVATLDASGATLDFSALDVSRESPFISGNLTVDSTTGWTFPSGLAENTAYKVCTGTLTPSATTVVSAITVGTTALYARLTFDTENSTVSYEEVSANQATVSADTTWSAITNTTDWVEGLPAEITFAADAAIEFDVTPDATVITLIGSYTATLVYTKAYDGTIAVDGASYEIKIPADATDFDLASAFTVPADTTYIIAGSTDAATTNEVSGVVTVNGTLKTTGYLNLSAANVVASAGTLEVVSGCTSANFASQGMSGTLTVDSGATFVNVLASDGLSYSGSPTVNVYGTLDMGATRWSVGANWTFNIYAGANVTGSGQLDSSTYVGAIDFIHNVTPTVNFKQVGSSGGTINLDARLRVRYGVNFVVEEDVTVVIGSATSSGATWTPSTKTITKSGAGTIQFASGADFISTYGITLSAGTLSLAGGAVSGAISGSGAVNVTSGTYDPTLSSFTGDITVTGDGTVLYLDTSELESAGEVTVDSGSILRIVVTEAEIASGYDATSYLTNNGTVQFYNESGTQITENVSGTVLSAAANNWATLAEGSWDESTGWSGGVPSASSAVCLNYADAVVAITANSTASNVVVSQSATISGTGTALAAFAENVSAISIASGMTLTLACTDDSAYTFSQVVSGDGVLAVSGGTVTFSAANTMTGGLIVKSGTLAQSTSSTGFGPQQGSVTVEEGASLDLLNAAGGWYNLTIAGTGTADQGAVFVSAEQDAFSSGSAQLTSITLSTNATIGVDYQWGLINYGYGATTLALGTYTLTKKGEGNFWLCNTTISGSGSLVVTEGNLALNAAGGSAVTGNSANFTINSGATMTVEQYNLTIGYLVIDAGGAVTVSSGKVLTAGYLTVNGDITIPDAGGVAVNHYLYGTGTMTYSALPASAMQSFMQNSNWTGTVVVPLTTSAAHFLNYYGNSGSTVAISTMTDGWFGNAAVESKVEILGAVTNTAFSSSFANTWASVIGSGSLAFTSSIASDSKVFWIKDVSEYAGDLATTNTVPLQLGGSSKVSAPYGDGVIEICTNMTATIASGKAWYAVNGIYVNGTLGGAGSSESAIVLNGTLDMTSGISLAGAVSLNDGATVVLPEGATLPYVVTTGTLTLADGAAVTVRDSTGAEYSGWTISNGRIITKPFVLILR